MSTTALSDRRMEFMVGAEQRAEEFMQRWNADSEMQRFMNIYDRAPHRGMRPR